ncbi:hypothetical protein K8640_20905 [Myxococcus sp. XM-1-1-1]|uniref:terpene synthase family protein n=1 Tax=Myxococcus sp. XM-1-1-1 TaxID=2874602 RepID=UPI001CBC7EF8|nr:hypothetical protein [Myxococcus sp. XM-1-1-1]MBZ4410677.1 hypothetical protein [Myxococcus sp. XM-1-1-1]
MHSRVPRIDLRYVAGISPDVEATRAHTLHWLAFQGLIVQPEALRTYDASRFDRLSARMCPNSRGAGLDLVSDWMGWLFVFDDQFDGPIGLDLEATRAVLDELLAVIQGSTPQRYPSSRLGAALLELWGRSTAGASASWKARFTQDLAGYFESYYQEARERTQGWPVDLETYLRTRRLSIGVLPSLDICERSEGLDVPPAVHGTEDMTTLRSLCTDVVVMVNDIYSAPKEAASGQMHNMVLLLMHHEGCGQAAAMDQVEGEIAKRVETFAAVEQRIRGGVQCIETWSVIDRDIAAIKNLMQGTTDWTRETARYAQPSQGARERVTG